MNDSASTLQGLLAEFQIIMSLVLNYLPKIAVAVLVLAVGWLLKYCSLPRFFSLLSSDHP